MVLKAKEKRCVLGRDLKTERALFWPAASTGKTRFNY